MAWPSSAFVEGVGERYAFFVWVLLWFVVVAFATVAVSATDVPLFVVVVVGGGKEGYERCMGTLPQARWRAIRFLRR